MKTLNMKCCKLIMYVGLCLLLGCGKNDQPGVPQPVSPPIPPPAIDTTYDIRILTYNIHHGNPPSTGIINIDSTAKVIRQQQPDLVALQEVDVYTNRSGKLLHEAAEIARLAALPYYYFAKAIDYDGGEYGVAILSRFPISSMANTPLPTAAGTGGEARTLATAVVDLPGNKRIVFAATHLDAQSSETNRLLQIQKLSDLLSRQTIPVIVAGDFNATPGSNTINVLDGTFKRSCVISCGFTIPATNPTKTIDFIAYRPADKFTVSFHQVINENYASDHLPVLAVLKIK